MFFFSLKIPWFQTRRCLVVPSSSFYPIAGDDNFSEVFSDGSDLPVNNLDASPEPSPEPLEALEPFPTAKAPEPEAKRMGNAPVGGQRGEGW